MISVFAGTLQGLGPNIKESDRPATSALVATVDGVPDLIIAWFGCVASGWPDRRLKNRRDVWDFHRRGPESPEELHTEP